MTEDIRWIPFPVLIQAMRALEQSARFQASVAGKFALMGVDEKLIPAPSAEWIKGILGTLNHIAFALARVERPSSGNMLDVNQPPMSEGGRELRQVASFAALTQDVRDRLHAIAFKLDCAEHTRQTHEDSACQCVCHQREPRQECPMCCVGPAGRAAGEPGAWMRILRDHRRDSPTLGQFRQVGDHLEVTLVEGASWREVFSVFGNAGIMLVEAALNDAGQPIRLSRFNIFEFSFCDPIAIAGKPS